MIVAYGLVAIAAQTLLFREFVTAFEGNDITVGVFFGSWFLWVGLGAVLVRRSGSVRRKICVRQIELLFLLYIPAFLVQLLLILQVRDLAGVASVRPRLRSDDRPVVDGGQRPGESCHRRCSFPWPAAGSSRRTHSPSRRVYILEAVGSFAGGLAVTALLARHVPMIRVSLLLAIVLVDPRRRLLPVSSAHWSGKRRIATRRLAGDTRSSHRRSCSREPMRSACAACRRPNGANCCPARLSAAPFTRRRPSTCTASTAASGSPCGKAACARPCPSEEEAGRTAATVLCQNPQARRILVIGSGLALCNRLLMLPQIDPVTWAHPDAEYAKRLLEMSPGRVRGDDRRFHSGGQ